MADKLYFSRDSKLYVELTSNGGTFQGIWEVPVLDGFSFSQATNQTEIGLQEMESTAGVSRRGRRLFTDSLSPAEWSFSTYMRPTEKQSGEHHLVDEVLWAAMAGADVHHTTHDDGATARTLEAADFYRNSGDAAGGTALNENHGRVLHRDANANFGTLTFTESNRATLPQITLYFVFETDTTNPMVYKLSSAIVNECSVDFDIDGIATANWSGFAKEITDLTGSQLSFVTSTDPRATPNVSITACTDANPGVFTSNGHGLQNGQKVSFADSAIGDGGEFDTVLRNKSFFVVESATNTFQLSETRGGSGVSTSAALADDYTSSDGAFTMTYTPPEVYLDNSSDFLLHVLDGTSYRQAFNTGVTSTANFIRNRLTQLDVRGQNPDVMEGKRLAITNYSSGTFTTAAHGLVAGDVVRINGLTGTDAATFNDKNLFVKTAPTTTTFTLSATADGTALGGTVTLVNNPTVATGVYSFTLTGGNMTISNNVTYLVPEEIGTINKPIEGVTGARAIGGSFTCYLVFDDATGDTGSSSDFFSDLVAADKGLTKVVNDFDVTFKVGGNVATGPRVDLKFPKAHIDVPTHSIEDVISLETNFGAYTEDFDSVDEFTMDIYGVSV